MKMFVWEYVSDLTNNWHSGGGAMVVAPTLERARELLPAGCSALKDEPSRTYVLAEPVEEGSLIFPDAGCC